MLNFRDDPQAFRAFIAMHQDRVFNLVLNKVQHTEDAEEITQDVFIDIYRKPESFRGDSAITTWIYRIAINKCIDHLRRQQARKRTISNAKESPAIDLHHPGVAIENREKTAMLFRAMDQLPEKQHTAWVLSEMENLSYKEIGEIMQLSLSSIESLLFRARQNLRKILAGMYPGEK